MTATSMTFALLLMLVPTTVNAQANETECRKKQIESFDAMMKTCDELKRTMTQEKYWGSACPFRFYPFVPTKKIPDIATYREMSIELRTTNCMSLPRGADLK